MFEGNSADTCAGKFLLVLMGAERRVSRVQGPHRRWQKFVNFFLLFQGLARYWQVNNFDFTILILFTP